MVAASADAAARQAAPPAACSESSSVLAAGLARCLPDERRRVVELIRSRAYDESRLALALQALDARHVPAAAVRECGLRVARAAAHAAALAARRLLSDAAHPSAPLPDALRDSSTVEAGALDGACRGVARACGDAAFAAGLRAAAVDDEVAPVARPAAAASAEERALPADAAAPAPESVGAAVASAPDAPAGFSLLKGRHVIAAGHPYHDQMAQQRAAAALAAGRRVLVTRGRQTVCLPSTGAAGEVAAAVERARRAHVRSGKYRKRYGPRGAGTLALNQAQMAKEAADRARLAAAPGFVAAWRVVDLPILPPGKMTPALLERCIVPVTVFRTKDAAARHAAAEGPRQRRCIRARDLAKVLERTEEQQVAAAAPQLRLGVDVAACERLLTRERARHLISWLTNAKRSAASGGSAATRGPAQYEPQQAHRRHVAAAAAHASEHAAFVVLEAFFRDGRCPDAGAALTPLVRKDGATFAACRLLALTTANEVLDTVLAELWAAGAVDAAFPANDVRAAAQWHVLTALLRAALPVALPSDPPASRDRTERLALAAAAPPGAAAAAATMQAASGALPPAAGAAPPLAPWPFKESDIADSRAHELSKAAGPASPAIAGLYAATDPAEALPRASLWGLQCAPQQLPLLGGRLRCLDRPHPVLSPAFHDAVELKHAGPPNTWGCKWRKHNFSWHRAALANGAAAAAPPQPSAKRRCTSAGPSDVADSRADPVAPEPADDAVGRKRKLSAGGAALHGAQTVRQTGTLASKGRAMFAERWAKSARKWRAVTDRPGPHAVVAARNLPDGERWRLLRRNKETVRRARERSDAAERASRALWAAVVGERRHVETVCIRAPGREDLTIPRPPRRAIDPNVRHGSLLNRTVVVPKAASDALTAAALDASLRVALAAASLPQCAHAPAAAAAAPTAAVASAAEKAAAAGRAAADRVMGARLRQGFPVIQRLACAASAAAAGGASLAALQAQAAAKQPTLQGHLFGDVVRSACLLEGQGGCFVRRCLLRTEAAIAHALQRAAADQLAQLLADGAGGAQLRTVKARLAALARVPPPAVDRVGRKAGLAALQAALESEHLRPAQPMPSAAVRLVAAHAAMAALNGAFRLVVGRPSRRRPPPAILAPRCPQAPRPAASAAQRRVAAAAARTFHDFAADSDAVSQRADSDGAPGDTALRRAVRLGLSKRSALTQATKAHPLGAKASQPAGPKDAPNAAGPSSSPQPPFLHRMDALITREHVLSASAALPGALPGACGAPAGDVAAPRRGPAHPRHEAVAPLDDSLAAFGAAWRPSFVTPGLDVPVVAVEEQYESMREAIMRTGEREGTTQLHPLRCPPGKFFQSQWANSHWAQRMAWAQPALEGAALPRVCPDGTPAGTAFFNGACAVTYVGAAYDPRLPRLPRVGDPGFELPVAWAAPLIEMLPNRVADRALREPITTPLHDYMNAAADARGNVMRDYLRWGGLKGAFNPYPISADTVGHSLPSFLTLAHKQHRGQGSNWSQGVFLPFKGRFLRPEQRFFTTPHPPTRRLAALAACARPVGLHFSRHDDMRAAMRRRIAAGKAPFPARGVFPWRLDAPARVATLSSDAVDRLAGFDAPRFKLREFGEHQLEELRCRLRAARHCVDLLSAARVPMLLPAPLATPTPPAQSAVDVVEDAQSGVVVCVAPPGAAEGARKALVRTVDACEVADWEARGWTALPPSEAASMVAWWLQALLSGPLLGAFLPATPAASTALVAHVRELAAAAAVPLFGRHAVSGFWRTAKSVCVGADLLWAPAAHPPPPQRASELRPLVIRAWTPFTWDEFTCVLELRRKELLAAEIAGIQRAQWQQDGWPLGRGGLELDGSISSRELTLGRLRRLPRAPVLASYVPTWWVDDASNAARRYVYSAADPLGPQAEQRGLLRVDVEALFPDRDATAVLKKKAAAAKLAEEQAKRRAVLRAVAAALFAPGGKLCPGQEAWRSAARNASAAADAVAVCAAEPSGRAGCDALQDRAVDARVLAAALHVALPPGASSSTSLDAPLHARAAAVLAAHGLVAPGPADADAVLAAARRVLAAAGVRVDVPEAATLRADDLSAALGAEPPRPGASDAQQRWLANRLRFAAAAPAAGGVRAAPAPRLLPATASAAPARFEVVCRWDARGEWQPVLVSPHEDDRAGSRAAGGWLARIPGLPAAPPSAAPQLVDGRRRAWAATRLIGVVASPRRAPGVLCANPHGRGLLLWPQAPGADLLAALSQFFGVSFAGATPVPRGAPCERRQRPLLVAPDALVAAKPRIAALGFVFSAARADNNALVGYPGQPFARTVRQAATRGGGPRKAPRPRVPKAAKPSQPAHGAEPPWAATTTDVRFVDALADVPAGFDVLSHGVVIPDLKGAEFGRKDGGDFFLIGRPIAPPPQPAPPSSAPAAAAAAPKKRKREQPAAAPTPKRPCPAAQAPASPELPGPSPPPAAPAPSQPPPEQHQIVEIPWLLGDGTRPARRPPPPPFAEHPAPPSPAAAPSPSRPPATPERARPGSSAPPSPVVPIASLVVLAPPSREPLPPTQLHRRLASLQPTPPPPGANAAEEPPSVDVARHAFGRRGRVIDAAPSPAVTASGRVPRSAALRTTARVRQLLEQDRASLARGDRLDDDDMDADAVGLPDDDDDDGAVDGVDSDYQEDDDGVVERRAVAAAASPPAAAPAAAEADPEAMNAFERERWERMQRNKEAMQKSGLLTASSVLNAMLLQQRPRASKGPKKAAAPAERAPARASARAAGRPRVDYCDAAGPLSLTVERAPRGPRAPKAPKAPRGKRAAGASGSRVPYNTQPAVSEDAKAAAAAAADAKLRELQAKDKNGVFGVKLMTISQVDRGFWSSLDKGVVDQLRQALRVETFGSTAWQEEFKCELPMTCCHGALEASWRHLPGDPPSFAWPPGEEWRVVLLPKRPSDAKKDGPAVDIRDLGLSGGWAGFAKCQKLQAGDSVLMSFELTHATAKTAPADKPALLAAAKIKTYIYRARVYDGDLDDPYAVPVAAAAAEENAGAAASGSDTE